MDNCIRVLHVLHALNCGGAENMIMNLYRNIDRNIVQFDFMVHSNNKGFFEDEVIKLGGRVFRVPYFNGLNSIVYAKSVRELYIKHPEIKIVHGHLGSCSHIYLNEAKKLGLYSIAHSHNTNPNSFSLKNLAYRLFTLRTRCVADYFFACSQKAGEDRFGKKIVSCKEKYSVLNNAIDSSKFAFNSDIRYATRNDLKAGDKFVIGHIGRFNEQKNHDFLIDIFSQYHEIHKDSLLVLVGDGDLRANIESKVRRLGLDDSIKFLGIRDNVNELIQAFDCMVFPSKFEGLPVTIIEAQASGLPCVISDNITKEVYITDLLSQVSLSNDISQWINAIESTKIYHRHSYLDEIKNNGYDINQTSKWLVSFYLEKANRMVMKNG